MNDHLHPIEQALRDVEAVGAKPKNMTPDMLKAKTDEVIKVAREGKLKLAQLIPGVKSQEAVKYIKDSVPFVAGYLRQIAERGLQIQKQTLAGEAVGAEHYQTIDGYQSGLKTELNTQKAELESFLQAEQVEKDLQKEEVVVSALEKPDATTTREALTQKYAVVDAKIKSLGEKFTGDPEAPEPRKSLLNRVLEQYAKLQDRVRFRYEELTMAQKIDGSEFKQYVSIDNQGNISYTPEFEKLKSENPQEAQRVFREIMAKATGSVLPESGVDLTKIENLSHSINVKLKDYEDAVSEYEKNPNEETRNKAVNLFSETEALAEQNNLPLAERRMKSGVTMSPLIADYYKEVDGMNAVFDNLLQRLYKNQDRFNTVERQQNDPKARETVKALQDTWKEQLAPKGEAYLEISSNSLPKFFELMQTPSGLLTPDQQKTITDIRNGFEIISMQILAGSQQLRLAAESCNALNLKGDLKVELQNLITATTQWIDSVKSDRVRVKSTEDLKKAEVGDKNLLQYVRWLDVPDKDGKKYALDEDGLKKLPPQQRELVRSRIMMMLKTNEEIVDDEAVNAQLVPKNPDDEAKAQKEVEAKYGKDAPQYIEAMGLLQKGDLRAGGAKLREFLKAVAQMDEGKKKELQPLVNEARERLTKIGLKQHQMVEDAFKGMKDLRMNLKAQGFQIGNDQLENKFFKVKFKPEENQLLEAEEAEIEKALKELGDRAISGGVEDMDAELRAISSQIDKANGERKLGRDKSEVLRLMDMSESYLDLTSQDPEKKKAAVKKLNDYAQKYRDIGAYDAAQKMLDLALENERTDASEKAKEKKGLTLDSCKKLILSSPAASANIQTLAAVYLKEYNRKNPEAQITQADAEQFLLNKKANEVYQKKLHFFMAEDVQFKDHPSVQQYQNWFPFEESKWYAPWTYSAQEMDEFKEECAKLVVGTLLTLPVGAAAGAGGRLAYAGMLRSMGAAGLKKAGFELVEVAGGMALRNTAGEFVALGAEQQALMGQQLGLRLLQQGGMGALKAGSKEMAALSPEVQQLILGQQKVLQGMGRKALVGSLAVEGGIMRLGGDITSYAQTKELPKYLQHLKAKEFGKAMGSFALSYVESTAKAGVFRGLNVAGGKIFRPEEAATFGGAVGRTVGLETFTGVGGTAVDTAELLITGRGKEINGKMVLTSLVQNALSAGAMHGARALVKSFEAPVNKVQTGDKPSEGGNNPPPHSADGDFTPERIEAAVALARMRGYKSERLAEEASRLSPEEIAARNEGKTLGDKSKGELPRYLTEEESSSWKLQKEAKAVHDAEKTAIHTGEEAPLNAEIAHESLKQRLESQPELAQRMEHVLAKINAEPVQGKPRPPEEHLTLDSLKNHLEPAELRLLANTDPLPENLLQKVIKKEYQTLTDTVDGKPMEVRFYLDGEQLGSGGYSKVTAGHSVVWTRDGKNAPGHTLRPCAVKVIDDFATFAINMRKHGDIQPDELRLNYDLNNKYEFDTIEALRKLADQSGVMEAYYHGNIKMLDGSMRKVIISNTVDLYRAPNSPDNAPTPTKKNTYLSVHNAIVAGRIPMEVGINMLAMAAGGEHKLNSVGRGGLDAKPVNVFAGMVNGKAGAVVGDLSYFPLDQSQHLVVRPLVVPDGMGGYTIQASLFYADGVVAHSLGYTPEFAGYAHTQLAAMNAWAKANPGKPMPPSIRALSNIGHWGKMIDSTIQAAQKEGVLPPGKAQMILARLNNLHKRMMHIPGMDAIDAQIASAAKAGDYTGASKLLETKMAMLNNPEILASVEKNGITMADVSAELASIGAEIQKARRANSAPQLTIQ